jgi:hypothetical protein
VQVNLGLLVGTAPRLDAGKVCRVNESWRYLPLRLFNADALACESGMAFSEIRLRVIALSYINHNDDIYSFEL